MLCVHVCVIGVWHMHFCQHMEVKVCQFICKTIASQAFLDVLGTKVWELTPLEPMIPLSFIGWSPWGSRSS